VFFPFTIILKDSFAFYFMNERWKIYGECGRWVFRILENMFEEILGNNDNDRVVNSENWQKYLHNKILNLIKIREPPFPKRQYFFHFGEPRKAVPKGIYFIVDPYIEIKEHS